jgi:hypothetical protein
MSDLKYSSRNERMEKRDRYFHTRGKAEDRRSVVNEF